MGSVEEKSAEIAYIEELVEAKRDGLISPHNGAVFYTTGASSDAVAYARDNNAVTLEGVRFAVDLQGNEQIGDYGTSFGAQMESRGLYWGLPKDRISTNFSSDEFDRRLAYADAAFKKTSEIYAQQASGDVEVFIGPPKHELERDGPPFEPKIEKHSVFASVECKELLNNEKVTAINGVDRLVLCRVINTTKPEERAMEEINQLLIEGHLRRNQRLSKDRQIAVAGTPPNAQISKPAERLEEQVRNTGERFEAQVDKSIERLDEQVDKSIEQLDEQVDKPIKQPDEKVAMPGVQINESAEKQGPYAQKTDERNVRLLNKSHSK